MAKRFSEEVVPGKILSVSVFVLGLLFFVFLIDLRLFLALNFNLNVSCLVELAVRIIEY